ncbi:MAG: right-handed parallel beta-helix repeat-containing protein [Thermodesulforhabdaceae bacterium]
MKRLDVHFLIGSVSITNVENYIKDNEFLFSRKNPVALIKYNLIEFSDCLTLVKNMKLSGEFELNKTVEINGDSFSIEGEGELVIKSKVANAFRVTNGGSLELKNVKLSYLGDKVDSEDPFIFVEGSKLIADGSELKGSISDCIKAIRSEIKLGNSSIIGIGGSGVYLISSRGIIQKSKVTGNTGNGINIQDQSHLEVSQCEIRGNGTEGEGYPQIWVKKSELSLIDSIVADSVGVCGIVLISYSIGVISNCKLDEIYVADNSVKCLIQNSIVMSKAYIGSSNVKVVDSYIEGGIKRI